MGLRQRVLYRGAGRAASRWDRVGPHRIHSRVAEGPDGAPHVVLLHGFGVSSRYMMPTAVRLAPDLAAFAPDLPGFGRTPGRPGRTSVPELARILRDWMDVVGLERPAVVGNSFGCAIAAELAATFPERVYGLVLVGPTADNRARSVPVQIGRLLLDSLREPAGMVALAALDYVPFVLRGGMRLIGEAVHYPIERRLLEVRERTLVVRGNRDLLTPSRWCQELVSRIPRSTLRTIVGCPHAVNYTCPDDLAAIVREFLRVPAAEVRP